jgi:hypothetical protein
MARPDPEEYAAYYHGYVALVPDGDILGTLSRQGRDLPALLREIPERHGDHRYADGKWTVKEVLGHLVDTERVFGCRALVFARGDRTPLPGMDPDDYVSGGRFGSRTIDDLAGELEALRRSHLHLLRALDDEAWARRGTASGCTFTTRAVAWILAGHPMHHVRVLEERYGLFPRGREEADGVV